QAIYALRLLGVELKEYSKNHEGRLPATLAEIRLPVGDIVVTDSTYMSDPFSQTEFKYVGSGRTWNDFGGNGVLAYTSDREGEQQCALFSSGYAMWLRQAQLSDELRKLSTANPQPESRKAP